LAHRHFLVVGGGFGQLPAILSAKNLGFTVLVADRNSEAMGMKVANIPLVIDTTDIEAIVEAARQYEVLGVLTMQSDIGVPAVGAVVDALGLKGTGLAGASRCSNKILLREALADAEVAQPAFFVANTVSESLEAAACLSFPCVIKAPDSSGSRGVVKVNDESDIPAAFAEAMAFSRDGRVLVEEYIDGLEFGAQAFSVGGKCEHVLVHDDLLSDPPYMIPIGHAFPSTLTAEQIEKVEITVTDCLEALGLTDGPSNIDLILDSTGTPRVIEVGARIGATCLPELVFHHTGINWVEAAISSASCMAVDLRLKTAEPCAACILDSHADGVFEGYTLSERYRKHPDILEWELTVKPGDLVSTLRKGTDRIGKVVTRGSSTADALALAQEFRRELKLLIRQ
jgi:biotin carboxylase